MSGLTIVKDEAGPTGAHVTVDRRLYLTADMDRLVEEGHPAARFLYCTPGKRVRRAELLRLGAEIVDPDELEDAAEAPQSLSDLTVERLQEHLRAHDLKVSGRKSDLIARLEEEGIGVDGEKIDETETEDKEDASPEDKGGEPAGNDDTGE